jgi:hypothetical protein
MVPCSFDETNIVLSKPDDMESDICSVLSALHTQTNKGMPVLISCWKITAAELVEINKTGRVWLTVCGNQMPPIMVDGLKPFISTDN